MRPATPPGLRRRTLLTLPLAAAATTVLPACGRPADVVPGVGDVVRHAQDVVRARRLGPTDAARLYAYVARVYRDVHALTGPREAHDASRRIARFIAGGPRFSDPRGVSHRPASARSGAVLEEYLHRARHDGHDLVDPPTSPRGRPGTWTPEPGAVATTPAAGRWATWAVPDWSDLAPPPAYGSTADRDECDEVRAAVARRTRAEEERVRFWRAGPGSVTPAGMWLGIAVQVLALAGGERPHEHDAADLVARLATVTADAARECWRVKYTYWTARPSQRMPNLRTTNADPPFPAYPSGHSTMSAAAATVLSHAFPQRAGAFQALAREARDSRLFAGVHFPVDNAAGFTLGRAVGEAALTSARAGVPPRAERR